LSKTTGDAFDVRILHTKNVVKLQNQTL